MKKFIFIFLMFCSISYSQNNEIQNNEEQTIEDTKELIIKLFNEYAYPRGSFQLKHGYNASFEDNYIRLRIFKSDNKSFINNGKLYDFSKSTQFHAVSYRSNDVAFINVFVSYLINEKKNKWIKDKLVIRINGHDNAELLQNALKQYGDLILKKRFKTQI